jgi:hypothetical protein
MIGERPASVANSSPLTYAPAFTSLITFLESMWCLLQIPCLVNSFWTPPSSLCCSFPIPLDTILSKVEHGYQALHRDCIKRRSRARAKTDTFNRALDKPVSGHPNSRDRIECAIRTQRLINIRLHCMCLCVCVCVCVCETQNYPTVCTHLTC